MSTPRASGWTPRRAFRAVAVGEAVTWALLLSGMFLKYVTETTELGVQVFGMVHGVVFIAYCLVAVVVATDQRWSLARTVAGVVAAVPPFATLLFEAYAERRALLGPDWRLRSEAPRGLLERLTAGLLRRPAQGLILGLLAVAGLTGVALVVGPPA